MVDLLDLHHLNSEEAEDELHWSAEKEELSLTAPSSEKLPVTLKPSQV